MNKLPRKQLVLKAVLLLRTVNRYSSKETQLKMMDKYYSTEQLEDYVEHFNDPQPVYEEPDYVMDDSGSEYYTHYSPSNPWDAPGQSIPGESEDCMKVKWNITKWCKSITDSEKDEYTGCDVTGCPHRFRLLDDDNEIYAYGNASAKTFEPLDTYMYDYGCTEIQYKNQETGKYETL